MDADGGSASGLPYPQGIPTDPALWKIENFRVFLEVRQVLLASELNRRMEALLHGDTRWLAGATATTPAVVMVGSGITSEQEEESRYPHIS